MSTTYDVHDSDYWEHQSLSDELNRVFDICHGCRRCYQLCPSFDVMLKRIDQEGDAEVAGLKQKDFDTVVDLCYQCKLCIPHCPYTPPHRWMVDFPRLMLRSKAVKAKKEGVSLQDNFLGHTDFMGKFGVATSKIANWLNERRAHRFLMEEIVGLDKDRVLPTFNNQTFKSWFDKHSSPASKGEDKIALFYTCSVNYQELDTGKSCVSVLEHNNLDVSCPEQKCCGMPFLDGGDVDAATENAAFNTKQLADAVRSGRKIVVPGPTCSFMLKHEYPTLVGTDEAKLVAENTFDICEYLVLQKRAGKLKTDFKHNPGKIAYHLPCHLRVQNIGFKSRDLMKLTGAQIEVIDRCSAVDGTWGFKKEYYQLSRKIAEPLFAQMTASETSTMVSDCPLAAIQIKDGTGVKPLHPIQIIEQSYGLLDDNESQVHTDKGSNNEANKHF
ncbi:MAG TPA: anaerobic glycerol-3-phosphate dehydrogenase subunit C [Blastocatellia bacterium]|nr:anaerobic glycerol-3-phosphate dehydrogenase subunit C [Blastocatellia bacterium]